MSQENVEVIRAVFRGWKHDALRRYWERFLEAWDGFDMGLTEFLDAGDHVFNGLAINGRGRDSGAEVAMEFWQVWFIRGDRAARCEEYLDRSGALEAAGLTSD
jgi:ketosteroid isomerase-like protein